MRRNTKVFAGIALSGVLLTACGGDDQPDRNQNGAALGPLGQTVFATDHTIVDRRVDVSPLSWVTVMMVASLMDITIA